MKLDRRSFFAALSATPVIARVAPKVEVPAKYPAPVQYSVGCVFDPQRFPTASLDPEIVAYFREAQERQERNLRLMFDDAFWRGGA